MTRGYNNVLLCGALVRQPERRYSNSGLAILEFTVGGDDHLIDHTGTARVLPWYHRSTLLGHTAEEMAEGLRGGESVILQGVLEQRSWTDKGGKSRSAVGVKTLRLERTEFGPQRPDPVVGDAGGGMRLKNAYNHAMVIGNLTRDPELRYTPSGDAVVTAAIAVTESFKNRAGAWEERVDYLEFNAWRELAEAVGQLAKGQALFVAGRLINEGYTDGEGTKRSFTRIEAGRLELLERRPSAQATAASATRAGSAPVGAGNPAKRTALERSAQPVAVAGESDYDFPPEEDLPF